MTWFWIWLSFAAGMAILVFGTHASYQSIGLAFVAWCGGVVSTLMVQERIKHYRKTHPHAVPIA